MSGAEPADRHVVLAGFAESLAAVEAVWCLLDHGHRVVAVSRAGARPAVARDPRVEVVEVPAPEHDLAGCVAAVAAVAARVGADTLLPMDDAALVVLDRVDRSGAAAPVVAGATGALAALALDKRAQLDAARRAGLAVPDTLVVEPGDRPGLDDVPAGDPGSEGWVVKPATAVAARDGRLAKGDAAFVTSRRGVLDALAGRDEPMLVQPHLRGVGRGVFGFAGDGGHRVAAWSGHERLRMMNPSGSGSSACRSWTPPAELLDTAGAFVHGTGWQGLFMLELLVDAAGRAWFMELNGRTWGSLALAERRGLHYPAWAVAQAHDPGFWPSEPVDAPPLVARHLGRELLHLAFVARGRHELRAARRAGERPRPGLVDYPTLPAAVAQVARWAPDHRLYDHRRGRTGVLAAATWGTLAAAVSR